MENLEILKVNSNNVKLTGDEYITIGAMPVKINNQAKQDLIKLSTLTKSSINKMNNKINGRGGYKVLNEIIRRSNDKLNLIVNKVDMTVERISTKSPDVSYTAFEEIIDHIVQKNDVGVSSHHILNHGTTNIISLTNDNPFEVGLVGENISVGKSIKWDMVEGISTQDHILRQICTNGMIGQQEGKVNNLNNMSIDALYNALLKDITVVEKSQLNHYERMVTCAMTTNLSVNEFNKIWKFLNSNYNADDHIIKNYIGTDQWKGEYIDRGIDIENLTIEQLKNCPSPVNTYDAINCLTDLASHTYKSDVSDNVKYKAQLMAHKKLYGTYDTLAYVPNLPKFKLEGPRMSSYQPIMN